MHHDISTLLTDLINGTVALRDVRFVAPPDPHSRTTPCTVINLDNACEAWFSSSAEGYFIPVTRSASASVNSSCRFVFIGITCLYSTSRLPGAAPNRAFLLQTLAELQMQPDEQETARLVVLSMLSHCRDLLGSDIHTDSRSRALFEAIRRYLDEHHASPLTRDSVARAFYISPNYLSHLFQKTGNVGFNEYLTQTRLEHARQLLKGYDLKSKTLPPAAALQTATTSAASFVNIPNAPLPSTAASITAS